MPHLYFETDENTVENIAKCFNTTKKSLDNDVKKLSEWLKTQLHLPEIMDHEKIRFFLILNKCNLEKTKEKIDMYYTIRSQIPDMYENINPKLPHMREVMDAIYIVPLPKLTKEMDRITIVKIRSPDMIDNIEPFNFVNCTFNTVEVRMNEDLMCSNIVIVDATDVTWKFIQKYTFNLLKKTMTILTTVYSFRFCAVYFINLPRFCAYIIQFLQAILKPKLFERIKIVESWDDIKTLFPKTIIPVDLGGDEKSLEELNDLFKLKMNEYQDRFDQISNFKVNEHLRPEKLESDILSSNGTFKKIDVD